MRIRPQIGGQMTSGPIPTFERMLFGEGSMYFGLRVGPRYSDPLFEFGVQLKDAYRLEDFIWRRPRLRKWCGR